MSQCRNVSVVQVEHHSQPYSLPLADFHVTPLSVPFSVPYSLQNFSYASVAVIAILLASLGVWLISVQSWFGGAKLDVDNSDAVRTKYWVTDPPRRTFQLT